MTASPITSDFVYVFLYKSNSHVWFALSAPVHESALCNRCQHTRRRMIHEPTNFTLGTSRIIPKNAWKYPHSSYIRQRTQVSNIKPTSMFAEGICIDLRRVRVVPPPLVGSVPVVTQQKRHCVNQTRRCSTGSVHSFHRI